ncbi:Plasmepsin III [Dirofilaria immitis]
MCCNSLMMFDMENKAVQCDLIASSYRNEITQILQDKGSIKNDVITEAVQNDSVAIPIGAFESVHCSGLPLAQDNEEVGGAKQGQNEQTISNDRSQSNRNITDEQQLPISIMDGNKSSLSGDREGDSSDGEGNGPIDEEKQRRRVRTRKDRVRDGLHGMLDAQHRAFQIKCMAHVIFSDFEQRMFMYQDKVRALCELIAEDSMTPEMFEKMHDIFKEEHEAIYFLLSFLFPQNLLPASVLENPIRKAYGDALEMMYNIEAFTSFGNTRLSARTIFRNVRDLGFDCTCETLTARLSELIGNKGPLWKIISQNIPTHICQSNYSVTDFEYIDLCSWRKMDVPFESVDLTTAIGAEMEKQRSGVFVGFLRNLFTERKGKLYEVVAEWKQTKITPPVPPRRRPPTRKTKKHLTLASIQLELPEIPVDELRQRLAFLLSLLQRVDKTDNKKNSMNCY